MATRTTDLRRRVFLVGIPLAVGAVGIGTYFGSRGASSEFERAAEAQLQVAARQASETLTEYLNERAADVRLLTQLPTVIETARLAGLLATDSGLDRLATTELEERFAETRRIGGDARLAALLTSLRDTSDFAEIFFTERHGFTVEGTNITSDFVQSDEQWWQNGLALGAFQAPATFDESAGTVGIELVGRIGDFDTGEPIGVLKALVELARISRVVTLGDDFAGSAIEAVDSTGRVVLTNQPNRLFAVIADTTVVRRGTEPVVSRVSRAGGADLVATAPTNSGRWWIVVRQSQDVAFAAARSIRDSVYLAAGAAVVVSILLLAILTDWLHRRVTQPVRAAGAVASRVASGDLSVTVASEGSGAEEVDRLLESVRTMVRALRQLVGDIRASSQESAAMAEQISASTEQMSASTQEMANTCQELTMEATKQAGLAKGSAENAGRILSISGSLADGAQVAAERTASVNEIAAEHRDRLISGSEQLSALATDLARGAEDAQRLADLSEEIQKFVAQARGIATQTNMLALNAAIEASRAGGGEGRGFAIVADEVRKLANQAARSANSTAETVRNVLTTVQDTRTRLANLSEASASVSQVAESAAGALQEVAGATAESTAWSEEISRAAGEVRNLVGDITGRLRKIATGTDSVVAAAEQIAASAEQQSASTEEIAASASQLANVSDQLTAAVGSFRLLSTGQRTEEIPVATEEVVG